MNNRIFNLILLFFGLQASSLMAQCPDLPTSLPSNCDIEAANRQIAECYSPFIRALAPVTEARSANGRADLIVSPFNDGNLYTGDNW